MDSGEVAVFSLMREPGRWEGGQWCKLVALAVATPAQAERAIARGGMAPTEGSLPISPEEGVPAPARLNQGETQIQQLEKCQAELAQCQAELSAARAELVERAVKGEALLDAVPEPQEPEPQGPEPQPEPETSEAKGETAEMLALIASTSDIDVLRELARRALLLSPPNSLSVSPTSSPPTEY